MNRKSNLPKSLSRNNQHILYRAIAVMLPQSWQRLLLLPALGCLSLVPVAHGVDISGTYVLENDNWLTTPLSTLNFTGRQADNLMIADIVDVFSLVPNHNGRAMIRTFIRDANVAGRYPWLTLAPYTQVVVDGNFAATQRFNIAAGAAGGIHLQSGSSLTLQNSNVGSDFGGALRVENGALTTFCAESDNDHFSFLNNRAANGGAVFVDSNAVAYIENGIVTGNEAHSDTVDVRGGAMLNNGMLVITQTTFSDNNASSGLAENLYGGAIYNSGELSLSDSQFSRNLATNGGTESAGGAIYSDGGVIRVFSSTFTDNQAAGSGGAIAFVNMGNISLHNVVFSNNSAVGNNGEGGAIAVRDAVLTFDNETPQSFIGNSATQKGGAIYLDHATATLTNTNFFGNRSEKGAAIYLLGSSLKQVVSSGNTTVFAGNQTPGGYESIAFESIADSAMAYNVNTEARAKLLMLDPMHVYNQLPVSINKTGSGTWELAGQNQLSQSEFSVNAGTLSLLDSGGATFSELNSVPHLYSAASLQFTGNGRFQLSSSATLVVNGNNTISGGQQWYEGTLAFNMQNAAIGNPMLTLINPTLNADALAGSGGVRIHNVNGIQDGIYTLINSDTINSTAIGALYLEASTTPYTNRRSLTPGAKFILLQQVNNGQQLNLQVANAYGNTPMTWSGNSNNVWDINNTPNWQGFVGAIAVSRFLQDDEVIFDSSATGSHDIVVADTGVTVKKMTLDGYYGFSGGVIRAGDLVLADNAQLRLAVGSAPSLRVDSSIVPGATGTLTIGNGAKLKLSGAVSGTIALLTTDGGITQFNQADVSMAYAGGAVDYLNLTSFLGDNGKTIYVTGELAWLSQQPNSAHGEFTLTHASDSYTLIDVLSDRSPADPTVRVGWNGNSLVKSGNGTLIIAADQAYSGTTTVLGGTLQLGNGGTTGSVRNTIHNTATVIINRSDNITFSNAIDGRGTLIKRGSGALTLSNPDNDFGRIVIEAGSIRVANNRQLGIVNNNVEFAGDIHSAAYADIIAAKDVFNRIPSENNLAAVAQAIYAANNDGSMPSLVVTAGGSLTMMGSGNQALVSGMGNIHLEEGASFTSTRGGKLVSLTDAVLLLTADNNASFHSDNVDNGSVIFSMGEAMLLNNIHFSNNARPPAQGTAITIWSGLNWINDSSFTNNLGGSTVYMSDGEALSLNRVSFTNNTVPETVPAAMRAGAALYVKSDAVFLNDVDFINNGLRQSDAAGNPVGGASDGGAIYFDQPGKVTMNKVRFIGNHANQNGGGVFFDLNAPDSNPVTLTDTLFIGNTAGGLGGANALASGHVTHRVSEGQTSVYAGNIANGISNSICFLPLSNAQFNPDTQANATLLMLDPISAADNATATINKTGSGTWKLAGNNQLQKTQMTISEGTLELVKDGSQQFDELLLAGRASNVHNYAATHLNFTSEGSFTLAAGGQLRVRGTDTALGSNSIIGGKQSFAGELIFDLQEALQSDLDHASSADDYSNPQLLLNADSWGTLPGSGKIRVILPDLPSSNEAIKYTLIDGGTFNTTAEGGRIYLNNSSTAHQNVRSTSAAAAPLLGLQRDPGHRYIQLTISDPGKNTLLTWQRKDSFFWDEGKSRNWSGNVDGIAVDTFLANDDVLFGDDPNFMHIVYVANEGVHVNSMTVAADYAFGGGTIYANTVTVNNGASLGIRHNLQPSLIATDYLEFVGNAHLNISGYHGGERVTLVHTENGIRGFDPAQVTIGGSASVDFLTGNIYLDNNDKDIVSDLKLSWETASNAHGTFTINNSDIFVLSTVLRDQTANANWDGKTLTKEGSGMLILAQMMEYTGRTYINEGTLRLGLGGESGNLNPLSEGVFIDRQGTLAFDWSNDVTYDGLISGDGSVIKYGAGSVTLTNPQSHVDTLVIEQGSVRIMGNPSVAPFASRLAFRGNINAVNNQVLFNSFKVYQEHPELFIIAISTLKTALELARLSGDLPTLRIAAGQTVINNYTRTMFLTDEQGVVGNMHLESGSSFISYGGMAGASDGGSIKSIGNYAFLTAESDAASIIMNNQAANGGAIYADDPIFLIEHALFEGNHADQSGGAVYNGGQMALLNVDFIQNAASAGQGGALYIADNAVVTQLVSNGLSYYAANIANGKHNSITLGRGATYKMIVLQDNQLNMLDPFALPNDNARIEKWGLGTWQISNENTVSGANVEIDIERGTLEFAHEKTRSVKLITGRVLNYTNQSAVLTMDATTTLKVNEGAALLFKGENLITGGTLILKGELAFDLLETTDNTIPMLTIKSKIDPDFKLGSGIVRVFNTWVLPLSSTANIIPLVHSASADQIASNGELYLGSDARPYVAERYNQPGIPLVGLSTSNNGQTLNLIVVDASTPGELTWSGAVNQIWDTNTTRNWNGTVAGINVNTFLYGDDVIFSKQTNDQTIIVAKGGVSVDHMDLQAAHHFIGERISANTVVIDANTAIGLMTGSTPSLTATTVNFGTNSVLNITGVTVADEQPHAVIQTWQPNSISGFEQPQVTIAGSRSVDFMTARAGLSDTRDAIYVVTGLTWMSSQRSSAHGTFTLPDTSDVFVLGVPLGNNQNSATHIANWDGTTLTKRGDGTLIFTADHTYTGTTTIVAGTLQLGVGGSSGSVQGNIINYATLRFNRADDIVYSGSISGSAAATIYKEGMGTLTLTGINNFRGNTFVNSGALAVRGSLYGTVNVAADASLNIYQGTRLGDVEARAANIGFYLPATITPNNILATAANVNIDGARIAIGIDGAANLTSLGLGGLITLLHTNKLSADEISSLNLMIGSTISYDVSLLVEGNSLLANLSSARSQARSESKVLSEAQASGLSALLLGSDLIADKIFPSLSSATSQSSLQSFGMIEASKQTIKTGSEVELRGYNAVTGMSLKHDFAAGKRGWLGAFFEYGTANFDTYNEYSGGDLRGNGDNHYIGGGIIGRVALPMGSGPHENYIEASLRGGQLKTKFRSPQLTNVAGIAAEYKSKTPYLGASLTLGHQHQLDESSTASIYARALWLHQGDESLHLSTGERIEFDSVSSLRAKLGSSYNYKIDNNKTLFAGAAFEWEFKSKVKATSNSLPIDEPDSHGASYVGDFGMRWLPTGNDDLTLIFGIQGYVGKRQGVTGSLRVSYEF